jgi:hypothetical protein
MLLTCASPQMIGVMPVASSLAKFSAMSTAAPHRNSYGEATIRRSVPARAS